MLRLNAVPRSERISQAQWAVTMPLLLLQLAGFHWALPLVVGSCAASAALYALRLGSVRAYRVQVRLGFAAFCSLGWLPGLEPILLVPVVGTSAQVLFGYCPMARMLDVAPWNRDERFSWELVRRIAMRAPGCEGLFLSTRDRSSSAVSEGVPTA
jgi:hypothetical protein